MLKLLLTASTGAVVRTSKFIFNPHNMIKLGDTVTDTENGQKLVVGKTVTLEAVERLPKRFVDEAKSETPITDIIKKSEEKRKNIQKQKVI